MSRLSSLWRNLVHRRRVDRELDEEMAAVFNVLIAEKTRAGMTAEQARRSARLELGGIDPVKQQVREERSGASLEIFMRDAKYAFRMLRANPGLTIVIVLSLAAGIGANTAIFSVANALVWRSLPVAAPDKLFFVGFQAQPPTPSRFSYPTFEQLTAALPEPHDLAAMSRVARVQSRFGGGESQPAAIQLVSGTYFSVFRLQPSLGRLLTPDDNRTAGAHPVAVISHAFWRRSGGDTGGDTAIVGRELTLNGARFTIVGVAPDGFSGTWLESPVQAWIPIAMQADVHYMQNVSAGMEDLEKPWMTQSGIRWLELVLRADRADGPEAAALNGAFSAITLKASGTISDIKDRQRFLDRRLTLESFANGASNLRTRFRTPLFALLAMTAVLLAIACANTANLLLARASSRQREMAVRLSIGASRGRVIAQLLTESVMLGVLAAAIGLAVAPLASELLVRMTIGVDSGPLPFSVGIDGRVLAFTLALSIATSLLFGLAPAWRATDLSLATALKSMTRSVTRGGHVSRSLVVAQVALSLLLIVGAGLFLQSFRNLATVPLGFEGEHIVSAAISPRAAGYQQSEVAGLYRRLIDAVEAIPGVQSATIAGCGLMVGCRSNVDGLVITGYNSQPDETVGLQENPVGPRYFATTGMPVLEGRDFAESDVAIPARVAIINEAAVRRYFKNRSAIGQRFGESTPTIEIVGVVRDARVNTVREAAVPMAYYPMEPTLYAGSLDVRAIGDPRPIVDALRKTIARVDPNLPVLSVITLTDQAGATLRQDRLIARLTTMLGMLALGLACLGLYGVMSYTVKQRTSELGVRFALGASRGTVLWTVLRDGLVLMGLGAAVAVPIVFALSRVVGTLLYDVSASNPFILAASAGLLLGVGATAGYIPAFRASRIDPLTALRHE